jgi:hypothetical protein
LYKKENKMKKLIIASLTIVSTMAFSQVIISGKTGTATNKAAVLLEFEAGLNKGIILPYVRTMQVATSLTPGTILVDASTATKAKVKYYAPGNSLADANNWVDLSSGNEADITAALANQPNTTELASSKAIIGATTTPAKGVLVLESTTKSMLLPQVASTDDVKDPAPGMMVYLNGTNKRLAVFNGAKWTFWAP